MNQITPKNINFLDTAPIQIRLQQELAAKPEAVFAVLANNETWPQWFRYFKSCKTTTPGEQTVGSIRYADAGMVQVSEQFIVWEPGKRWFFTVIESSSNAIKGMVEGAELQTLDNGHTLITWRMGADCGTFINLFSPLIKLVTKRILRGLLNSLEQRAQSI